MRNIVNNGGRLANELHFLGELKHHQSVEDIIELVRNMTDNDPTCRFMDYDEFWEDFDDRAEELGYILKR